MKLYENAMTPSCQRVNVFLKEISPSNDIERINVDIRSGENLAADFVNRGVNGKVPLLEVSDGVFISESVAICRYLDSVYSNELALFGKDALEQAQVEMWHRIIELQLIVPSFQAFRNLSGFFADRETCVEAWGVESKKRLEAFIPQLEQRLAESTFIAGERYTIVDITVFIALGFVDNALKLGVYQANPNLKAWSERVGARPAFQNS